MTETSTANTVFVQVIDRPERKMIIKRGIKATGYFEYCDELGCDIEKELSDVKEAVFEPVGMWLPKNLVKPGTSVYVMGVEVPFDYAGEVPEGYEVIELKPYKDMVFQGPPFDDEKYGDAIHNLWEVMKTYNPEIYGFAWADEDGPRVQLSPQGYRGYIESKPVKQLNVKK